MIGIIGIVCIKKTPVEMRGPGTSKHCVTNMVADEEAVIAAVITAIFLVNKEEEENREIVHKGEETCYVDDIVPAYPLPVFKGAFACPEVHLKP